MRNAKRSNRTKQIGQSCEGKKCRTEYKKEIIKNFSESVTTPHMVDLDLKQTTCLYCGKITKLRK